MSADTSLELKYLECVGETHQLLRQLRGGFDINQDFCASDGCRHAEMLVDALFDFGYKIDWTKRPDNPNYRWRKYWFDSHLKRLQPEYSQYPITTSTFYDLVRDSDYIFGPTVDFMCLLSRDRFQAEIFTWFFNLLTRTTPITAADFVNPKLLVIAPLSTDFMTIKCYQHAAKRIYGECCQIEPALLSKDKTRAYIRENNNVATVRAFIDISARIQQSRTYASIADVATKIYGEKFLNIQQ